jgi:hypothetical protein
METKLFSMCLPESVTNHHPKPLESGADYYTLLFKDHSPIYAWGFKAVFYLSMVSVLDIGPKVRGFEPNQGDRFLRVIKSPQHTFLRRVSKTGNAMS